MMPLLPTSCRLLISRRFERDPTVRRIRRIVAERTAGTPDVLEIGCGFGANGEWCQGEYVGVDVDAPTVAVAQRRLPDCRLLVWDVERDGDVPGAPFHTVLLCMTVHELGGRRDAVITRAGEMASTRLLVIDYDPGLRGWSRVRESLLEMGKLGEYTRFDLVGFLSALGWRVGATEAIGDIHRCWEFERCR